MDVVGPVNVVRMERDSRGARTLAYVVVVSLFHVRGTDLMPGILWGVQQHLVPKQKPQHQHQPHLARDATGAAHMVLRRGDRASAVWLC